MKNTQKTHKGPKKKWVTIIQQEDFNDLENQLTGNVLQNCCSEKFEKFSRKRFLIVYSFLIFQPKTFHQGCFFFAIFSNMLEQLRTGGSKIIQGSSLDSVLSYRSSHLQELQRKKN